MNDLYTTAINTQKATVQWMDVLADNLTNVYTPGFRENKVTFKTKDLQEYFDDDTPAERMTDVIRMLLEKYKAGEIDIND